MNSVYISKTSGLVSAIVSLFILANLICNNKSVNGQSTDNSISVSTNVTGNPVNNESKLLDPISSANLSPVLSVNSNFQNINQVGPIVVVDEDVKIFEEFKKSNFYINPFEVGMIKLPVVQREYLRKMIKDDLEFFRQILREAIDKRNKFAPSVSLMFKYSAKLLGRFIKNFQGDYQLPERVNYHPDFFKMIAKLLEVVIDKSGSIKKVKSYTKQNVDTDDLYHRTNAIFNWLDNTMAISPLAGYLRWNETVLFRNDLSNPRHDSDLVLEAGDLLAQFRGMGYESCMFVARRIINLLNMFSRGLVPSVKEV